MTNTCVGGDVLYQPTGLNADNTPLPVNDKICALMLFIPLRYSGRGLLCGRTLWGLFRVRHFSAGSYSFHASTRCSAVIYRLQETTPNPVLHAPHHVFTAFTLTCSLRRALNALLPANNADRVNCS